MAATVVVSATPLSSPGNTPSLRKSVCTESRYASDPEPVGAPREPKWTATARIHERNIPREVSGGDEGKIGWIRRIGLIQPTPDKDSIQKKKKTSTAVITGSTRKNMVHPNWHCGRIDIGESFPIFNNP